MATSIYFNGRVTSIPGSYSEVDASGLASVGLGASGIVACIGEVEGSEPAIVQSVSNPGKISKIFRSGDLLEAGTMLFDPSKDPDIPGGAQEVKFVKVNPATQSTTTLEDSGGSDSITFTSEDWGAFTEKISVDVSDGTAVGTKAVTVSLDSATETFDNIGEDGVATIQYTGTASAATVSFASATTGLTAAVSDAQTASTYGTETALVPGYAGSVEAPAQPNGTSDVMSCVSDNAADTFNVTVYGKSGGVADTETITLTGLTPANGVKVFTDVYAVVFAQAATGSVTITGSVTGNVIALGNNTTAALDASAAAYSTGGVGSTFDLVADGATTDEVIVVGTSGGGSPAMEIIALAGTSAVTTTTAFESVIYVGLGKIATGVSVKLTIPGFDQTAVVAVQSTDAADTTQTLSIWGLDGSDAVQAESVLLSGTAAVNTSGTYKRVYAVELSAAAAGTVTAATIAAVHGVARTSVSLTRFSLAAGTLIGGMDDGLAFALNGTALSWSASPSTSVDFIVIGTNASGGAQTVRYTGASGTTSEMWSTIESVTTSHIPAGVTNTVSYAPFGLTVALYPTFDTWENFFSDQTEWTLTKDMSATSATYSIALLDDFTAQDATGTGYEILDILNDIITTVNAGSALVTAARATGATLPPANTTAPVYLTGGGEGTTSFTNWQAALDTLRDYRVNTIVVMTTDAAVHAAAIAHCAYMCGPGRSERDCLLGMASGTTLALAKAGALSMNTRHARLFIQDVQRFNTDGEKERFAPPFTACLAAGMQAGSSVGTSLTFKFINLLDVYGDDATYTIQDDANELINSGLCMIEKVPNRGWRWLRNITTYLIDNNLAYTEGSVNEAVNYAVYNLRQSLEAIVGQKGFAGTVTAAEGIAIAILGQLVIETVITSYRNLDITLTDDVMTIDVEVAPVIPVNFVKTTIHLVSASFANE